jgi:ribulose-5-phosphate 4-epimerase/fuculose-1-phosphate aldolase
MTMSSRDNPALKLVDACRHAGARVPGWVQGAGGNISVKKGDTLYIKGSGRRLDEISPANGVAAVSLGALATRLSKIDGARADADYAAALTASAVPGPCRPSMETGFHAVLPETWVAHLHSLVGICLADQAEKDPAAVRRWLEPRVKGGLAFLPAVAPGWELVKAIEPHRDCSLLLLANHGVVLQGANIDEVLTHWERLEHELCQHWRWSALLPFLRRAYSPGELALALGQLPAAPLARYFPDASVFFERLTPLLQEADGRYRLLPGAELRDRDALEIWAAIQLLHAAYPKLPELDSGLTDRIVSQPLEAHRKKVASGGSGR